MIQLHHKGNYFLQFSHGLSQFERDLIADRTKQGLMSPKKRGAKLGRPNKYQEKKETILQMYNSNYYSINDIISATGI